MSKMTTSTISSTQTNPRRSFLKGTLSVATIATVSSTTSNVFANDAHSAQTSMLGIIYTQENPGKWAKKVGGHLPSIEINEQQVTIKTDHGMSSKHYIVRHTLVTQDGQTIGDKTFTPDDDEAISSYTLPAGYKGKLFATSFCNKHDFWLAEITV
jgi:superoxide reductase